MNKELTVIILANGTIQFEWEETASGLDKNQQLLEREIFQRAGQDFFSGLLFLGFSDKAIPLSTGVDFWRNFSLAFISQLRLTENLEALRDKITISLADEEMGALIKNAPFMRGTEYLDEALIRFLWARLNSTYQRDIKTFAGSVADFFHQYSPNLHLVGRVNFHLVENRQQADHPFAFLATYSTQLNKSGKSQHIPLKYALKEYGAESNKLLTLLTTVHAVADKSNLIKDLLESGEIFHPLAWDTKDTYQFLQEIPLYQEAGVLCRIPNWWKNGAPRLKMAVTLGAAAPSHLGMDSILNFDAQLLLGDSIITVAQARKILAESEGLAYIKGKWVEVNREKLASVLTAFEGAHQHLADGISIKQALKMKMGNSSIWGSDIDDDLLDVSHGQWLDSVLVKLRDPGKIEDSKPGKDFKATLRPYQTKGLTWLSFLHSLQFGACLADDMGLGKTLQVLAFLNKLKSEKKNSARINHTSLLVLPASLLANWAHEIDRFSPSLTYFVAHPGANPGSRETLKNDTFIKNYDLIITTYGLIQRYAVLNAYAWHYVILDEAQAIKNPGTQQTKAVKKLNAYNRIILTGTPIENRLSDLWSLYDFINPGLLGNASEFSAFTKGLKENPAGFGNLKAVISPYLLRRLKTDRTIIKDIPDKIEMKSYSSLSKRQIVLYKKLVEDISKALETLKGIERKGIILGSLIKFKQICNHPDQYLGNQEFLPKDSGKFQRLQEICQTIVEKREKVLIFTQFKEIIPPLNDFLNEVFGYQSLVLHGSIPVPQRRKIIERFQSNEYVPFFILSIKAGGVGLNLTAANHVIHFDRWWNPAVENQATDRVFRIGQQKNVIVHKFISQGTVEEKIDQMIEEKSALSDSIITSTQENWVTEMDNQELLNLFKLSL